MPDRFMLLFPLFVIWRAPGGFVTAGPAGKHDSLVVFTDRALTEAYCQTRRNCESAEMPTVKELLSLLHRRPQWITRVMINPSDKPETVVMQAATLQHELTEQHLRRN